MTPQPIKMWVLHDPANVAQLATVNLQTATRIFRQQFSGITFKFGGIEPNPGNSDLDEAVADSAIACDNLGLLTALPGVNAKHLNIFYLDVIAGYGIWCGDQGGMGRNIILMGANAKSRTLAHEIGHALLDSGRHANPGVDGFSDAHVENLITSNAGGEQLTLGQLFRASLSPASPVNRHGARSGPQATCSADSASPDSCPALTRDVTPR